MAVIFAIGGGAVAIIGAAMSQDDYSDGYSYDDWGEYSDAAERKHRRLEAAKQETEALAQDLSSYKRLTVNPQLRDQILKQEPAMAVSKEAMDQDAVGKISEEENREKDHAARIQAQKIEEIHVLLNKIQKIEEEEKKYES